MHSNDPFAAHSPEDISRAADEIFTALAQEELFSGAVQIMHGRSPVWARAYGLAQRDFAAANTLETRFNVASINKMWTAVAVAQWVERGKLAFTDTLERYLGPDWLAPEVARRISVGHLLAHSAGLGNYFTAEFDRASRRLYRDIEDFKPLVRGVTPSFAPGTQFAYSDIGFLLAGVVVEKVSGRSYYQQLEENVLRPAGMTQAAALAVDEVNPNTAVGYYRIPRGENDPHAGAALDPKPSAQVPPSVRFGLALERERQLIRDGFVWKNNLLAGVLRGGPAGGYYARVEDLCRFAAAFRDGELVSPAMVEQMTTPKPPAATLGYGTLLYDGAYGHSGNFPGISGQLTIYASGWILAVLSNFSMAAGIAALQLEDRLRR